jgi:hypothetical protein
VPASKERAFSSNDNTELSSWTCLKTKEKDVLKVALISILYTNNYIF